MKSLKRYIASVLIAVLTLASVFSVFTEYALAEKEQKVSKEIQPIKEEIKKETKEQEEAKRVIDKKTKKKHCVKLADKEKTQVIVKYKNPQPKSEKRKRVRRNIMSNDSYALEAGSKEKKEQVKEEVKKKLKSKKLETKKEFKLQKIDIIETEEEDVQTLIKELSKSEDVEYVQPNYKLTVNSGPLDKLFSSQWSLQNSGQEIEGEIGRAGVDVNIMPAWEITKGKDIIIGVLDTGIDIYHEDLTENIYINQREIKANGIDDDNNGYIDDVTGWDFVNGDNSVYDGANYDMHGTAVAGIIAAKSNEKGITGVAPKVKIMPLKFINGTSGYTCDAIQAIEYAMQEGVKIINCSFGGSDNNYALKDSMKNSGILFITSAGNRGGNVLTHPTYPACFNIPNVLSVASITNMGVLSKYSGYGKYIDVAAPGEKIMTTMPENEYNTFSGTSAAAAHVTAIAALLKSNEPQLTNTQIAQRIKENVVECKTLKDRLATKGRVNAFAVLSNTKPEPDTYEDTSGETPVDPGDNGFNDDSWYTMDQLAKIKEQMHYGKSGVNPSTGNYSFTVNDMSIQAPGFKINISRTYNAKNERKALLGKGWTFGFEGKIEGENNVQVSLPNGSVQIFRKKKNGTYEPQNNRSTFIKNQDGTFTLKTKDQYTYTFNEKKHMKEMKDPKGNTVVLELNAQNKITKIKDIVGREFQVSYNAKGYISTITDPIGRKVAYNYESDLLKSVTDPQGSQMKYSYDSHGYINEIKDNNDVVIQTLKYNHTTGYDQGKVIEAKDVNKSISKYTYDTVNKKTTIIENNNNKIWVYWYDKNNYITKIQNPEGEETKTEYYKVEGENKYGDIKSETDEYGNITRYEIDDRGNITKITYPDGSVKTITYDEKNNVIKEKDQENKSIYYVYDSDKTYLKKEVSPLKVGQEYVEGQSNEENFAITTYNYYADAQAQAQGYRAKGLLKDITDTEGSKVTYTYDQYGNVKTETDPEGNTKTYTYNQIGWKISETTAKQYTTRYIYNNNGQIQKVVYHQGETKRIVYDALGRKIKEILPNQYRQEDEDLENKIYKGDVGTRYEYYQSGQVKTITDPMGNVIKYTYDIYGNIKTKTNPNGGIYQYTYDKLDRIKKIEFKEAEDKNSVTLEEYTYSKTADNKELEKHTLYLNKKEKAQVYKIFDFAGRIIKEEYPDGTRVAMAYYKNGEIKTQTNKNGSTKYYYYDQLNRLEKEYIPLEIEKGETKYTYKKYSYDKAGRKIKEKIGVDKVTLNNEPKKYITVTKEYYKNGKLKKVLKSSGQSIVYIYDQDGNIAKTDEYIDDTNKKVTEFEYIHLNRLTRQTEYVRSGDIYGNDLESTEELALTTSYTYDLNGNVKTLINKKGETTTFEYDENNNQISVKREITGAEGNIERIITKATYNYQGDPLTKTDPKGNKTIYEYDKMGQLIKTKDSLGAVVVYEYDLAGRKTKEITPNNYDEAKSLEEMNRIEYTYDKMDRLKTKEYHYKDKNNEWQHIVAKAYKYNAMGQPVKELDALGYKAGRGKSKEEKINRGYGVITTYNLAGMVKTKLDPVAKDRSKSYTTKYEYDARGRKITEINAKGVITSYYYDDADNIIKTTRRKSKDSVEKTIAKYTYDKQGNLLTNTDALGNTTIYTYNKLGQIKSITYPKDETIQENIETYQYDKLGKLLSTINSLGKQTIKTYDVLGRLVKETQQSKSGEEAMTTSYTYDMNSNVLTSTDGNGNVRTYIYDKLNRKISEQNTTGGIDKTTTYEYDLNGNLISTTDWKGNTYTKVYDSLDRLIEERDAYGKIIQRLEYNENSAQRKSIDALGNETSYQYDKNNRLIYTIDPLEKVEGITYDDIGNIATKTDKNNRTTTYRYDESNNLEEVLMPEGTKTKYKYDLNKNLVSKIDGNENETIYEYNVRNIIVREISPDGRKGEQGNYIYNPSKITEYTYYKDGVVKTKTNPKGDTITYIYDIHQRLKEEKLGEKVLKAYEYDKNSNLLKVTDERGITTFTYDEENRMLTKSIPAIGTLAYEYDIIESVETGEVKQKIIAPKGKETLKTFDRVGRLKKVESDNEASIYAYNDNGSRKEVQYPNGVREKFEYNKRGEITALRNENSNGARIQEFGYTYDNNGNQLSKTDSSGTTSYKYDSLNRLKTVTEPNGKTTNYTFDKAGNRESQIISEAGEVSLTKYTYNKQNHLEKETTQSQGKAKITNYEYDENGNIVSKSSYKLEPAEAGEIEEIVISTAGDGKNKDITLYEYDTYNQLTRTITDNKTADYSYDYQGYRIKKTVKTIEKETNKAKIETTKYLYNRDKVIQETDEEGNISAQNVYGMNLISRTVEGKKYYYLYNAHADVTGLADREGNITDTYRYDAFGKIVEKTGESANPYRYAGYQYDEESNLYYLKARYYDSKIARFITEDTYKGQLNDPLSLNLYTYCCNEPIMYIDPTGHWGGKHGEYDDRELSADDQNEIIKYTRKWYKAETDEERDYYHGLANDIRKKAKLKKRDKNIKSTTKRGYDIYGSEGFTSNTNSSLTTTKPTNDVDSSQEEGLLESAWNGVKKAGNFIKNVGHDMALGALDSIDNNCFYGAGQKLNKRQKPDTLAYKASKTATNIVTFVGGIAVTIKGGATETAGLMLDATGVGAPVGVPLNALGALEVGYGVTVVGSSYGNFKKDFTSLFSSEGSSGGTGEGDFMKKWSVDDLKSLPQADSKGIKKLIGNSDDGFKFFKNQIDVNTMKEVKPGVFIGKDTNGLTFTYRAVSKSGPPTIDINGIKGIRKIKFLGE
ncbi:S8 family serine peptidase [Clostridiaceae bacterium M8S5]|nr:S8 family serine peptidase [Clostridiaceae bacterium M8S5]